MGCQRRGRESLAEGESKWAFGTRKTRNVAKTAKNAYAIPKTGTA
jgi:hypothetical protein